MTDEELPKPLPVGTPASTRPPRDRGGHQAAALAPRAVEELPKPIVISATTAPVPGAPGSPFPQAPRATAGPSQRAGGQGQGQRAGSQQQTLAMPGVRLSGAAGLGASGGPRDTRSQSGGGAPSSIVPPPEPRSLRPVHSRSPARVPRRFSAPARSAAPPVARFPLRPMTPSVRTGARRSSGAPDMARQRRRGSDLVGLVPRVMSIFAWFSLGVAGTFYDRAHPHGYGLDILFGVRRSLAVNTEAQAVSYAMVWVTLALCLIGLAFNSRRMRRTGDRYNRSLLLLGFGCTVGLLWRAIVG